MNPLEAHFRKKQRRTTVVWFRWRAFLQYLLFAYSNLRGLKRYWWNYYQETFPRGRPHYTKIYPLLLFDLLAYYLVHKSSIRFRNVEVVIYDRQFIDIVMDILSYCLKAEVHVRCLMLRLILRLLLALAMQVDTIIVSAKHRRIYNQ